MFTLVGELPRHLYCYVDASFCQHNGGFIPALWFGLVSYPDRVWGCTVLLENGAIFRNLPTHAIAFNESPPPWGPKDAQTWNCYGQQFTTLEYSYLHGLRIKAIANGQPYLGEYLFTAAPVNDGFSAYPEQAKEFVFVKLDNGRLTVQPTNRLIAEDKSFTTNDAMEFPKGMKVQVDTWSAER